uniref:Uncharacterized protein n=1 Tax=Tanacetum cinerariifolium TaxID=118510 RepID=A0A6L2JBE4_TANCI|nr:hypothetical protein [Tanacetum cinerariifolium]
MEQMRKVRKVHIGHRVTLRILMRTVRVQIAKLLMWRITPLKTMMGFMIRQPRMKVKKMKHIPFLETVKPLTKYVPETSQNNETDPQVFYGNDPFYVFFRLHHLLAIATDEVENKLIKLYVYEHMRKPGRFVDDLYNANMRVIVNDETIYRFSHSLIPETNRQTRLTIRLMDSGCEASEAPAFSVDPSLVPYRIAYVLGIEDSMVRKGRKKITRRSISQNDLANLSNGYLHQVQKFRKVLQSRIPESLCKMA